MSGKEQYKKGVLYQYDGQQFVELQPSDDIKLPVVQEAADCVKATRKRAQQHIGMRPELSLVASAMLLHAAKDPGILEEIRVFGAAIYSKTRASIGAEKEVTTGDSDVAEVTVSKQERLAVLENLLAAAGGEDFQEPEFEDDEKSTQVGEQETPAQAGSSD